MVAMCIMALINLAVHPVGDGKPPPPAIAYLSIVPTIYVWAIMTDTGDAVSGGTRSKKK